MSAALRSLLVLVVAAGCSRPPEVRDIAAERGGGQVRVHTFADRQLVEVTSPKGIGAADVPLARPPRPLRFTFHLRGLEQLRFTYDDVEIVVTVTPGGGIHQSLWRAGAAAREITAGDPFWMPVRIVREPGGAAAAPIAFIDVDAPPALRDAAPESCRIDWVDFFR